MGCTAYEADGSYHDHDGVETHSEDHLHHTPLIHTSDMGWHAPLEGGYWGAPSLGHEQFSVDHGEMHAVHGTPGEDMEHWHMQTHSDTCAIVSQEFILDSFGVHLTEEQLRDEATQYGLYTPGGGTPIWAMGDLLAVHGIPTEDISHASISDIEHSLDAGQKVMVAVDSNEIWNPEAQSNGHTQADVFGTNAPNHAVEVIGTDYCDPAHPMVILNDPGSPEGQGMMVPMQDFLDAWQGGGNYMVHTVDTPEEANSSAPPPIWQHTPSLCGYGNADGTYHYTSDNTDRDPETGAIVRRY